MSKNERGLAKRHYLKRIAAQLKEKGFAAVISRPAIPNVIFQPDLLVVPYPGITVAVFAEVVPYPEITWELTFELLEKLFELKAIAGAHIVAILVLLGPSNREAHPQLQLLGNMFDQIVLEGIPRVPKTELKIFAAFIDNMCAKEKWQDFWLSEKEYYRRKFEWYYNRPHIQHMVQGAIESMHQLEPIKSEFLTDDAFSNFVFDKLRELFFPVQGIHLGTPILNDKYPFEAGELFSIGFDFVVTPEVIKINPDGSSRRGRGPYRLNPRSLSESRAVIFEVVRLSRQRSLRALLQRLAIQARLLNYEIDVHGEDISFIPFNTQAELFLVVDDYIKGPRYAPARYVNMLVGACWQPVLYKDLSKYLLTMRR